MGGRLDGEIAVISGAGSSAPGYGVGKATAVLFAREGAQVVLVDKVPDRAEETLRLVEKESGVGVVVEADLADDDACERVAGDAVAAFGGISILVNNAAIASLTSIADITPEEYDRVLSINLRGAFMLTRAVIPVMIERGGGAIANITSIAAIRGTGVGQTAYAAAKAGLLGMTADVACTYGRQGIRINSISPGHIATPMLDQIARDRGIDPVEFNFGDRTALGFEGDAWDIARAALFLCSSDARYITGVHLPVDGGSSVRVP